MIQEKIYLCLGPALFFSRCPGRWGKLERKKQHLSIKNNDDWGLKWGRRNSMNEIRTIKLLRYLASCLLYHCVNTQQQLPFLAKKASQYLPFILKNSSWSTTWEQHRFCIESPVFWNSNHFEDSISPILRISLGGKEEACIVIGPILHTIKTRQADS